MLQGITAVNTLQIQNLHLPFMILVSSVDEPAKEAKNG
jgi:hypothetical protein